MRFILPLAMFLALSCPSLANAPTANKASVMIPIADEINADNLGPVKAKMEELIKNGDKTILFQISSPGGYIGEGWDFVDYLKNSKKKNHVKVQCLVNHYAASMAAVILESACDERWMVPQGYVLFHQGSTSAEGRTEDIRSAAQRLDALNHGMSVVVAKRLGMTLKDYEEKIRDGNWSLDADAALAAHAIDAVKDTDELPPLAELAAPPQNVGNMLLRLLK